MFINIVMWSIGWWCRMKMLRGEGEVSIEEGKELGDIVGDVIVVCNWWSKMVDWNSEWSIYVFDMFDIFLENLMLLIVILMKFERVWDVVLYFWCVFLVFSDGFFVVLGMLIFKYVFGIVMSLWV